MTTDIENKSKAIANTLQAIEEAHKEYTPLFAEYMKAMSSSGGYEINPDYKVTAKDVLTPAAIIAGMASGEITNKGRDNAVSAGKIRKITVAKPEKLVKIEAILTGLFTDYHIFCNNAIAPFQVKAPRTRSSSGAPGEVGIVKQQDVAASIRAIDPAAVINFSGRRVFGTLSNGVSFDYDAYGQSYIESLTKKVHGVTQ